MGTGGGHGGCRAPKPQRDPSPGLWLGLPAKAVKGPAPQILWGSVEGARTQGLRIWGRILRAVLCHLWGYQQAPCGVARCAASSPTRYGVQGTPAVPWGRGAPPPPHLPARAAFALGRGARHRVPSPSRVPAGVGRAGHEGASPMGPRPRGQERWRRRRRGDGTGRGSCSLPSPVGVLRRGPIATGRNRLGRPGEAFCRSAGVEPGRGWCLGCPGGSPGPPAAGWSPAVGAWCWALPSASCHPVPVLSVLV